jgi:hypothetical protein
MKRFRRVALLLVAGLLLGQLAQLVHANDLNAHADGGTCDICLSSQVHDQATVCPQHGLSIPLTHECMLVPVPSKACFSTHVRYLSRAPPR